MIGLAITMAGACFNMQYFSILVVSTLEMYSLSTEHSTQLNT